MKKILDWLRGYTTGGGKPKQPLHVEEVQEHNEAEWVKGKNGYLYGIELKNDGSYYIMRKMPGCKAFAVDNWGTLEQAKRELHTQLQRAAIKFGMVDLSDIQNCEPLCQINGMPVWVEDEEKEEKSITCEETGKAQKLWAAIETPMPVAEAERNVYGGEGKREPIPYKVREKIREFIIEQAKQGPITAYVIYKRAMKRGPEIMGYKYKHSQIQTQILALLKKGLIKRIDQGLYVLPGHDKPFQE